VAVRDSTSERSDQIDRTISPVNAVLFGVVAGIVVGAATSPLQGWLSDSASSLANSAGTWSLVAFLAARRSSKVVVGAVVAAVTLAMCEVGYALATEVRGGSNATSTVVFWIAAAVLAGPPLGVAGTWTRQSHPLRRGAGFGVMSGVLVGEGVYGLTKISDTTDWRYWTAEIVVAAGLVAWVAWRHRSITVISSCVGMTCASAVVVYCVAVTA
jgi:hypothetical protein